MNTFVQTIWSTCCQLCLSQTVSAQSIITATVPSNTVIVGRQTLKAVPGPSSAQIGIVVFREYFQYVAARTDC